MCVMWKQSISWWFFLNHCILIWKVPWYCYPKRYGIDVHYVDCQREIFVLFWYGYILGNWYRNALVPFWVAIFYLLHSIKYCVLVFINFLFYFFDIIRTNCKVIRSSFLLLEVLFYLSLHSHYFPWALQVTKCLLVKPHLSILRKIPQERCCFDTSIAMNPHLFYLSLI